MFFNEKTADIVQFITFPLEVAGFILVYTEIWKPKIFYLFDKIFLAIYSFTSSFIGTSIDEESNKFSEILGVSLTLSLLIFAPFFLSTFIESQIQKTIFISVAGTILFCFISNTFIYIFFRLSNSKTIVGGFGFFLASLGVLGELYQVITKLIN